MEISDHFYKVMTDAPMVDMVATLIGPDVKYHHCKINSKLPGSQMVVHYHQDFSYTPHTNDDVITALLLLDDVDEGNGCLMVVPGTHKGAIDSLYESGEFTGKVNPVLEEEYLKRQVPIEGKAGSVCLMHTRLLHGPFPSPATLCRPNWKALLCAAKLAKQPAWFPWKSNYHNSRNRRPFLPY